jgi:hypothetical protein
MKRRNETRDLFEEIPPPSNDSEPIGTNGLRQSPLPDISVPPNPTGPWASIRPSERIDFDAVVARTSSYPPARGHAEPFRMPGWLRTFLVGASLVGLAAVGGWVTGWLQGSQAAHRTRGERSEMQSLTREAPRSPSHPTRANPSQTGAASTQGEVVRLPTVVITLGQSD